MAKNRDNSWKITVAAPFQGFAPAYWATTYPEFGNRSMAGDMTDIDILDPTKLTQGPGIATLTNGDQGGAVSTLMKGILDIPTASDTAYAVGGAKLYKISSTTVTSDGTWPHTIDKAVVTGEDGEDIIEYQGNVYYTYNHSGSAGDIGKLTEPSTFDDDWGSTTPTGAATLQDAPHPLCVGDDDIMYFGNGRYVGYYDGVNDVISVDELDLMADAQVVDIGYAGGKVVIAANLPNLTGNNANYGVIYFWDGISESWEEPTIEVPGRIGSILIRGGAIYVFYTELSSSAYKLGYVQGNTIQEIESFSGSLPLFYQKTIFKGMIAWISNAKVHLWGTRTSDLPVQHSQYMDCGHATAGGLANTFGSLVVASTDGSTNFKISKPSGYATSARWYSLTFPVAVSIIDKIRVHYNALTTDARVDFTLRYNRGASTLSLGDVRYANESGTLRKTISIGQEVDDFRLELSWANGSASNPLDIRMIEIFGHSLEKD